jgi:hypothetical protein
LEQTNWLDFINLIIKSSIDVMNSLKVNNINNINNY